MDRKAISVSVDGDDTIIFVVEREQDGGSDSNNQRDFGDECPCEQCQDEEEE
mgnify:CR=1 FL=1